MSAVDAGAPIYGPFFGVMGAASAIIFSGKYDSVKRYRETKKNTYKSSHNARKETRPNLSANLVQFGHCKCTLRTVQNAIRTTELSFQSCRIHHIHVSVQIFVSIECENKSKFQICHIHTDCITF